MSFFILELDKPETDKMSFPEGISSVSLHCSLDSKYNCEIHNISEKNKKNCKNTSQLNDDHN